MSKINEVIENKLKELEKTSKKFWNIPPETGKLLSILIKSSGYKNILEIGTSNGYSAIWLAQAVAGNGGHVTTLEFYEERIAMAKANLEECGLAEYVTIKQGDAVEMLDDIVKENSFDFIFIDANKAEYIQYFQKVHPALSGKGVIVADNVTSHRKEMLDFLETVENHPEYQTAYIPFGGGSLICLKL